MARMRPQALLLALSLAVLPRTAAAQTAAADKAAAEALFQQGLDAMRAGKLEEACTKLEQSQSIERGIGTSLYLAECYEKSGRTASAWGLFREAASEAEARGEMDRALSGKQRADRLEPTLSRLTLQIPVGTAVPGFELLRDGAKVPEPVWNVAVPVDPGEHRVVARAPGYAEWSAQVTVGAAGANASLSVPPLSPVAAAPLSPPPPAPMSPPSPPPRLPANATEGQGGTGSSQRTLGIVIGGAGIVALGVGGYFGARALSKNDDAKQYCAAGGSICQAPEGETLTSQAESAARLANVFVISGAVLAVGGVVVFLTAPSDDRPRLGLVTDGRSAKVSLGGAF